MKYINFNIIKKVNIKKKIKKKQKSNVNETGLGIFPFYLIPFNFLNEIGLRIKKNKRAESR